VTIGGFQGFLDLFFVKIPFCFLLIILKKLIQNKDSVKGDKRNTLLLFRTIAAFLTDFNFNDS
jgi:hypothetical protein